jgi:hypothetical protein
MLFVACWYCICNSETIIYKSKSFALAKTSNRLIYLTGMNLFISMMGYQPLSELPEVYTYAPRVTQDLT